MGLSVGIVGLPNVGKSTLFSALSGKYAEAANYAFCTIDPNVGVVPVPDPRFDALVKLFSPAKTVPAAVEFVDIAGLVRGASKGEGKGNAFLSNIRECDAIAQVVRCFDDDNVLHVDNRIDPVGDIETIETELILRDMQTVEKRLERARRAAKGNHPVEKKAITVCEGLRAHLDAGRLARSFPVGDGEDEAHIRRDLFLITDKPLFYVCNVKEDQLATDEDDSYLRAVRARAQLANVPMVVISAQIEAEIAALPPEERADFLASVGLEEPGLNQVIRTGYRMLNLITYFTAGEPEVHAWTIEQGTLAPQAAGKIHSDFEKGFIRAEVMACADLVDLGSESAVRAAGKLAIEGKQYEVRDGDVMHFRV